MNSLSKGHLMNQGTQFQLKNCHIPKLFCCFWKSCITDNFIECIPSARSKRALFCLEAEELSFHTWYSHTKYFQKLTNLWSVTKVQKSHSSVFARRRAGNLKDTVDTWPVITEESSTPNFCTMHIGKDNKFLFVQSHLPGTTQVSYCLEQIQSSQFIFQMQSTPISLY